MRVRLCGTVKFGATWCRPGDVVDLADGEGRDLIALGFAIRESDATAPRQVDESAPIKGQGRGRYSRRDMRAAK